MRPPGTSTRQFFLHPKTYSSNDAANDHDQWIGDILQDPTLPNVTRLVFHNVNGFKSRDSGVFYDILATQQTQRIDIQCISEHQRDTTQFQVTQTLYEAIHKIDPREQYSRSTPAPQQHPMPTSPAEQQSLPWATSPADLYLTAAAAIQWVVGASSHFGDEITLR